MTINHANVDTSTDDFGNFVTSTNQFIEALREKIVTTDSNTATGNSEITGTLLVETLSPTSITGYIIGTDVQAYDPILQSISNISFTTDTLFYAANSTTIASSTLSEYGRDIINDASANTVKDTLNISYDLVDYIANVSLDLDFTVEGGVTGTFTRASVGTYYTRNGLVATALEDKPRINYHSANGVVRGLLIEQSATNLIVYSEDFSNVLWVKDNSSLGSTTTAPDGTTVPKLVEDNSSGFHRYNRTGVNVTSGNDYTASAFIKADERDMFSITFGGSSFPFTTITFDLGAETSTGGVIEPLANGWYRCSGTVTANATGGSTMSFEINDGGGNRSYAGDGSSGLYIWGTQMEVGEIATSYIKTDASTVTRAADIYSIDDVSWFNANSGMFYVESDILVDTSPSAAKLIFNVNNDANGFGPRHQLSINTANNIAYAVVDDSSGVIVAGINKPYLGKTAISYTTNTFIATDSGVTVAYAATSNTAPANVNQMTIGSTEAQNSGFLNGHIKRIIYSKDTFSNTELEQLTS